jgi:predicted RNA-binding Zn-ribbon protein involved in translation (DUF1610 family)
MLTPQLDNYTMALCPACGGVRKVYRSGSVRDAMNRVHVGYECGACDGTGVVRVANGFYLAEMTMKT